MDIEAGIWEHYNYEDKIIIVNSFVIDAGTDKENLCSNLFIANEKDCIPYTDASVYDVMQEVQQIEERT